MDVIFNFIRDHYHVIAECTLTLIVLFVTLFKRKVKIDDVFKTVLTVIPDFINEAEASYSSGADKYSFVFKRCVELLVNLTHKDSRVVLDQYTSMLNAAIESILSTPQKKER